MVDALTQRLQAIDKVAMLINTGSDTKSVSAALRQTLHYRADATVVLSGHLGVAGPHLHRQWPACRSDQP